jgi:hypothetical protein
VPSRTSSARSDTLTRTRERASGAPIPQRENLPGSQLVVVHEHVDAAGHHHLRRRAARGAEREVIVERAPRGVGRRVRQRDTQAADVAAMAAASESAKHG